MKLQKHTDIKTRHRMRHLKGKRKILNIGGGSVQIVDYEK